MCIFYILWSNFQIAKIWHIKNLDVWIPSSDLLFFQEQLSYFIAFVFYHKWIVFFCMLLEINCSWTIFEVLNLNILAFEICWDFLMVMK